MSLNTGEADERFQMLKRTDTPKKATLSEKLSHYGSQLVHDEIKQNWETEEFPLTQAEKEDLEQFGEQILVRFRQKLKEQVQALPEEMVFETPTCMKEGYVSRKEVLAIIEGEV